MGLVDFAAREAFYAARRGTRNGQAQAPPDDKATEREAALRAAQERAEALKAKPYLADRLSEAARMFHRYIVCTDAQADALALEAAHTHVLDVFVTTNRLLVTSDHENSGKTVTMELTAALSSNAEDLTGTSYSMQSMFAENAAQGKGPMTLYYDEISEVFGQAGTGGAHNPLGLILRKGYKKGAKSSWSVNRVKVEFSTFGCCYMTGLRTAVPRDIYTRCIVIRMENGIPADYFDARDGEARAGALRKALGASVKGNRDEIGAFRGRGIHPKLNGRRLEIWEPLYAVANAAGPEWLARCHAAFLELALDESDTVPLSPDQQVVKDCAETVQRMAEAGQLLGEDGWFVPGLALIDELKRVNPDAYAGRTDAQIAKIVSDALPFNSEPHRFNGNPVRGYQAAMILDLWDAIRPADQAAITVPEEVNTLDAFSAEELAVLDAEDDLSEASEASEAGEPLASA